MSSHPSGVVKDDDNSLDLYDEALVRDANHPMSPFEDTEDGYDQKSPFVQDRPLQSISDKIDKNDRKNFFQFYVGNLTWWTTDKDLANLVIHLGVNDLLDIRIFDKRTNGQSKGFCLVSVGSERSFRICMQKLSGLVLNGNSLVTAPYTKQWYSHFDDIASAQSSGSQFKNQKLELAPPTPNITKPPVFVETENRCVPVQSKLPPANLMSPQQIPLRMPLWPPNNRPGSLCPPPLSPVQPRRPSMPINGCTGMPTVSPVSPMGQWRYPPKVGQGPLLQPSIGMWPRAPSPHHGVFHPGHLQRPPLFSPQPPTHMIPQNHSPAPPYGRQPLFNQLSTLPRDPTASQTVSTKNSNEVEEKMETIVRNRAVTSKALLKAMDDAGNGNYSSAVETLTTAVELIEQSKMSRDERSQTFVSTLSDMLQVVVKKSQEIDSIKRSSDSHCGSPSSHVGTCRSSYGRSRKRSRSASRSRGSCSRSHSRERDRRDRSHHRVAKDDSDRGGGYNRDRENKDQHRDRALTSSRRRSDRSSSRTRYVTTRDRDRDHDSGRGYDRDLLSSSSKKASPSSSPDHVKNWGQRRRDS